MDTFQSVGSPHSAGYNFERMCTERSANRPRRLGERPNGCGSTERDRRRPGSFARCFRGTNTKDTDHARDGQFLFVGGTGANLVRLLPSPSTVQMFRRSPLRAENRIVLFPDHARLFNPWTFSSTTFAALSDAPSGATQRSTSLRVCSARRVFPFSVSVTRR